MSCNCLQGSVLYSPSLVKFCHFGSLAQSQKEEKKIFLLSLPLLIFQADTSEALISIVKECTLIQEEFLRYLPYPTFLVYAWFKNTVVSIR